MGKKGGGSQLSQLKSMLHSEGVTDRRQMKASAKKRKRGQAGAEKDEMAARRDKLSKIAASAAFNPFEERVTKPKNDVLGRKIRGATGKPGVAKLGGLKERNERLLPEWQTRNKSGSFVDRRFGENGSNNLSMEEKMLERFTKERQNKAGKSSLFNLDDAEEEGLTHYGKSLNDMDDYDDIHLSDEDEGLEEEGPHFGGFGEDREDVEGDGRDDSDRQRTKAEVMREVMAKSKLAKYERQKTRLADDDLRVELDNELGDIRSLLFDKSADESKDRDDDRTEGKRPLFGKDSKPDVYDSAVREMAFERRAKPQNRLKTEAEKAEELAESLQKAENDRLRRMRGEEVAKGASKGRGAKGQPAQADDLEDDFEMDGMTSRDVYGLGQGLHTAESDEEQSVDGADVASSSQEDESGEDDESDEEEDFGDLADVELLAQPGEDEDGSVDENAGEEDDERDILVATSSKRGAGSARKTDDQPPLLPYTFPCPTNHDELMDILESNKVADSDVPLVIKRIRALHHTSLSEQNKFKLQAFLGVLLDHIAYLAHQISSSDSGSHAIRLIDAIIPQIFTLSQAYPAAAADHFVNKLALMQRNLTRGLSKGPTLIESRTWPGATECILLKTTGALWPTSDQKHPVTTPLSLLIGQYLSSCRIRTLGDLGKGLYLCTLAYNHESQSRRVVPEALNFLHNGITLLAGVKSTKMLRQINQAFGIPWPDYEIETLKSLEILPGALAAPEDRVDFIKLIAADEGNTQLDVEKATLLQALSRLTSDFARLYTGSTAFVELFAPFEQLLEILSPLSTNLEQSRSTLKADLSRLLSNAKRERRALRLQAHRAVAIASHIPKFDQGYNPDRRGGRTFDPDVERAEQSKLRALLKKERKGAIRELRRDNEFLANEKRREREEEDQRYKKTIDRITGSLSTERGEQKKYMQDKATLKRRSGKK